MSIDLQHDAARAECQSLRRQLKDAYEKCTAIYEALSVLDEYSTRERVYLEKLVLDLKQTIGNECEKNAQLYMEKMQVERKEKFLQQKLNYQTRDLQKITIQYRRIYVNQQQQKYIENNLYHRMKKEIKYN